MRRRYTVLEWIRWNAWWLGCNRWSRLWWRK